MTSFMTLLRTDDVYGLVLSAVTTNCCFSVQETFIKEIVGLAFLTFVVASFSNSDLIVETEKKTNVQHFAIQQYSHGLRRPFTLCMD